MNKKVASTLAAIHVLHRPDGRECAHAHQTQGKGKWRTSIAGCWEDARELVDEQHVAGILCFPFQQGWLLATLGGQARTLLAF